MLDNGDLSAMEVTASSHSAPSNVSEVFWLSDKLEPTGSLGPQSPASSTASDITAPLGPLGGMETAGTGGSGLDAALLEPQLLGELVELVTEESAEDKKARRRVQDAIHARQKRSRKKVPCSIT